MAGAPKDQRVKRVKYGVKKRKQTTTTSGQLEDSLHTDWLTGAKLARASLDSTPRMELDSVPWTAPSKRSNSS